MKILEKYIAKEFAKFFFLLIFGFTFMVIIGSLFSKIGEVLSSLDDFIEFMKETALLLPALLEMLFPLTVLLATIATFSLLNRSSEIVAMKSSGIGFYQLAKPVLFVCAIIASLSYLNQHYLYPWMNSHWGIHAQESNLPPLWKVSNDAIFYIESRTTDEKIKQTTVFNFQDAPYRMSERDTIAEGRQIQNNWNLHTVLRRYFQQGQIKLDLEAALNIPKKDFPAVPFKESLPPHNQKLSEISSEIIRMQAEGQDVTLHKVEFYQKLAYPFTIFIMALIGLSLSLSHDRQGKGAESLALSLLLGVIFVIFNQICLAIGSSGLIGPIMAAWLANVIFFGIALYSFHYNRT